MPGSLLLLDRDARRPLFLQVKEAEASVLEEFTAEPVREPRSTRRGRPAADAGGQRHLPRLGAASTGRASERDYYVRQLRDWKGSADIEGMTPAGMKLWGQMCGWTLARAHARSGDRVAIAAYLGKSDVFDRAIAEFSVAYADQNERDYQALKEAVSSGRLAAETSD